MHGSAEIRGNRPVQRLGLEPPLQDAGTAFRHMEAGTNSVVPGSWQVISQGKPQEYYIALDQGHHMDFRYLRDNFASSDYTSPDLAAERTASFLLLTVTSNLHQKNSQLQIILCRGRGGRSGRRRPCLAPAPVTGMPHWRRRAEASDSGSRP